MSLTVNQHVIEHMQMCGEKSGQCGFILFRGEISLPALSYMPYRYIYSKCVTDPTGRLHIYRSYPRAVMRSCHPTVCIVREISFGLLSYLHFTLGGAILLLP